VRLITFRSYSEHTEPIFKELHILDIFKINDYLTALFMYRYYYLKNLPEAFENYFVTNNEIHNYNTRNATKLHKCCKITNYVIHTLSNKGVNLWNTLDTKFKRINSYNVYKRLIKQHVIVS
jgi:hypothetical protein